MLLTLTLALLSKQVRFKDLPGFDRLSGLMMLIAVSFSVSLLISKLFVGVFLGGSLASLLLMGAVLLVLLQSAWGKLTRK
ncbi:MAG: hypothetical protein IGS03_06985 [Candidatus Sericytochromatia bacterium]|nr:hypothetical protein [Candidatus Sericytochromatia bacterium]